MFQGRGDDYISVGAMVGVYLGVCFIFMMDMFLLLCPNMGLCIVCCVDGFIIILLDYYVRLGLSITLLRVHRRIHLRNEVLQNHLNYIHVRMYLNYNS
jgi:hypothetical protein